MDNRLLRCLAFGAGFTLSATLTYLAWANRRLFTVSDVQTSDSPAYPTLRSRVYYADGDGVLAAAEHAVRGLPGWRIVHSDADNGVLMAEAVAIAGALDDVTLTVESLDLGQTRVTIRSRSRQGRGDLGSNAGHIRLLQDAMDRRLMNGAAI